MTLKHAFQNNIPDPPADVIAGKTLPSHWDADHVTNAADTTVLFSDSGAVAGDAGLTYDKTTNVLTVSQQVINGGAGAATVAEAYPSQLIIGANDSTEVVPLSIFNNTEQSGKEVVSYFAYRGTIGALDPVEADDPIYSNVNYARSDNNDWSVAGFFNQVVTGIVANQVTSYFTYSYYSDLTAKGQGIFLWSPRDEPGVWWYGNGGSGDYSAIAMPSRGNFALRFDESATTAAGTTFAAETFVGAATALKSATTAVDVSAATAPTSGQVLTATAGNAATWQTPAGGGATLGANTFTALQTITPSSANVAGLAVSGVSVTGSNTTPLATFAAALNTSGAVNAFDISVADTASAAGSTYFRVRAGSAGTTEVLAVNNNNQVRANFGFVGPVTGMQFGYSGIQWAVYGTTSFYNIQSRSDGCYSWTSSTNPLGTVDTGIARAAAGVVEFNNGVNAGSLRDAKARNFISPDANGSYIQLPGMTVANLPASPVRGMRCYVTDSNAVSYTLGIGATVVGGGSTVVPVFYNGANWLIG